MVAAGAEAADEVPDWYREGPTLGDTLFDSKIELTRRTQRQWADAGFQEKPGEVFPTFLEMPNYWAWREVDERLQSYEFPTAGRRRLFVGTVDRFNGDPFNGECRFWAVDRDGNRTRLNHNEARLVDHDTTVSVDRSEDARILRREMRIANYPQICEHEFALPEGTVTFVIEKLHACEPWQMGWVDERSRIEMVAASLEPFGRLSRMIETANRRHPELGRLGNRETHGAKVCVGLWTDCADVARRYYWHLPTGQQEIVDGWIKDRSKVDRPALAKVRDLYVRYFAVVEPKLKEYRDIRLGGQFKTF